MSREKIFEGDPIRFAIVLMWKRSKMSGDKFTGWIHEQIGMWVSKSRLIAWRKQVNDLSPAEFAQKKEKALRLLAWCTGVIDGDAEEAVQPEDLEIPEKGYRKMVEEKKKAIPVLNKEKKFFF